MSESKFNHEQIARARCRSVMEYESIHIACGGALRPSDEEGADPSCYECGTVHWDDVVTEGDAHEESMSESLAWALDALDEARRERDKARKAVVAAFNYAGMCRLRDEPRDKLWREHIEPGTELWRKRCIEADAEGIANRWESEQQWRDES